MNKLLLLLIFICSISTASAQNYKLSGDPAQFIPEMKVLLATSRNEETMQVANQLEEIWNTNQLTSSQQAKVIAISQKLAAKKLRARPHFENFYGALASAVQVQKLANNSLDQFLNVTEKTLQNESVAALDKFLATSYSFLKSKIIYKSQYNSLRVEGGSFSFAYRDGTEPVTEEKAGKLNKKKETDKEAESGNLSDADANADEDVFAGYDNSNIPVITGAVLQLNNVGLYLVTQQDSLLLKDTDGALLLTRNIYVGDKGQFTWSQANGEANVAFEKFSFDTSKPAFKAENVTLTYPAVLEEPVTGLFEFRSNRKQTNGDFGYPKFSSKTNNARIKNIGENMQYLGGFTMAGNKISTAALDGSPSDLTVILEGKPKFKATAANYTLSDSLITSDLAAVIIFQGQDSLVHPNIKLRYRKGSKDLLLTRSEQSQVSPFYSTYHQMELNAEMLTWNLATPLINFSILNAKSEVPARFTSMEYFTDDRYEQLQGSASFHPLIVIANYADKQNINTFFLSEVAASTQIKEQELAIAAAMLARQNFLTYKSGTGEITLKPKAIHYMKSARGKKDYDYITLRSLAPSGKNATLDLSKNELVVRGVDKFYFTGDSSAVYALPDSNQVRIQKNRSIKFNGVIVASLFRFRGSKFTFQYDEFLVDMPKIDTIAFTVKKKTEKSEKEEDAGEAFLSNSITRSAGKLYLNKPDNKSGKEKYPNFPLFDATAGAYVYFNKPQVLGGAYDTTVFFQIPPFKMDSLNAAAQGAVGFKGFFHSGGIFPPIETKLGLMPDQSLGFEYTVPKGGLPAYGGKGKFYNKLTMSYKGLQGSGEINYLTTKLESNAFTFYLDKVLTLGTKATVAESTIGDAYFMQAHFNRYALEWLPQKDTMNISTTTEPIKLYQDKFLYRGIATVTPKGFFGDGTIEGADGSIESPHLQFAKTRFKANNATLQIKSKTPNKPAIRASDVFLEYDVAKGFASFSPEKAGVASTDFPYAQFKTSLSGGKWDVNKKLITMNEPEGNEAARAYFLSTRATHDNLKFKARSAKYDIGQNTLTIGGVPYIAAADAHIVPDSNRVFVTASSDLKTFQNATVISDTLQKYHQVYKGEIDIISRLKYQGSGTVKYVNALSDTFAVKFGKFTMKNMEQFKTIAKANVKKTEDSLADADAGIKVREVNTEILPDDTTSVVPDLVKKTRKFALVGGKKKARPTDIPDNLEASAKGPNPGPDVVETEPTLIEKKAKKSGLWGRKQANADTSAVLLADEPIIKKEKRRSRKEEIVDESAIPEDAAFTAAVATIKEDDHFIMAPGVRYKGDITMNSIRPNWHFDGQVKLAFSGDEAASDWFPYQATVNPAEVKINIKDQKAADGTPLKTGLHIAESDNKIYNTFVSKKKDETDLDLFEVEGQLSYNKSKKEFRLGEETRVSGEQYAGNLLVYNDSLDVSRYEGKFNLIRPLKKFTLSAAGTALANPTEKIYTLNALLAFNMPVPDAALVQMSKAISENTAGAPEASTDIAALPYWVAQFVGNKEAATYAAKDTYTPLAGFSSAFVKSLVFSGVQMHWSDSTHAWYSQGKLNLANILKKDINVQVPGYIEIKRGLEADIVSIYLEPLPSLWYYFNLDNNVLLVASSDEGFNGIVSKKRNSDMVTGEAMDKAAFVNAFRKTYLKNAFPDAVAPTPPASPETANFDFTEESGKKKKKKEQAADVETDTQEDTKAEKTKKRKETEEEPAQLDQPEGGKKKKKNKKEKDEGLLPDVDLN